MADSSEGILGSERQKSLKEKLKPAAELEEIRTRAAQSTTILAQRCRGASVLLTAIAPTISEQNNALHIPLPVMLNFISSISLLSRKQEEIDSMKMQEGRGFEQGFITRQHVPSPSQNEHPFSARAMEKKDDPERTQ